MTSTSHVTRVLPFAHNESRLISRPAPTAGDVTTARRPEFQRHDRLTLTDVCAAVVMKPEGGLTVAEDVGDRAIGLAGVEHRRRREVAKILELQL